MRYGSDIDGTLLDYNYIPGHPPKPNVALIEQIARRTAILHLITNQGGLPFGVQGIKRKDGRGYPAPEDFVMRLVYLDGVLRAHRIQIAGLYVCVFHPKAPSHAVKFAAETLSSLLTGAFPNHDAINVFFGEQWRKPAPDMLRYAGVDCYYGDSDEDEQAASGLEFVRVERFFGQ